MHIRSRNYIQIMHALNGMFMFPLCMIMNTLLKTCLMGFMKAIPYILLNQKRLPLIFILEQQYLVLHRSLCLSVSILKIYRCFFPVYFFFPRLFLLLNCTVDPSSFPSLPFLCPACICLPFFLLLLYFPCLSLFHSLPTAF